MKKLITITVLLAFMGACNIEKKKEGELPTVDVDIDTKAGELPDYDIAWADVNVGTTTKTVQIPKVVIVMEEEEVEVPYIDVDMPNDQFGEKEERTLMIEAEVSDYEHDIEIKEILASQNTLYVIAELKKLDTSIDDKKMRVSDQITLNAPDLNVKYYVVGERPDRVFNKRYKYITYDSELKEDLDDYTVLYE